MNYRLKTSKKNQIKFFQKVKISSDMKWTELAVLCNVSDRTLRDWARAKYLAPHKQYIYLSEKFFVSLPKKFKLLDNFWYVSKGAKLGGLTRYKIHGCLGNKDSRRRGGIISQRNRRVNPEKYRRLGCIVRKEFIVPEHSDDLAELVGIILGDGSVGNNQVSITLDRRRDKNYSVFVNKLIIKILKERPTRKERDNNTIILTLSGVNLIKILEDLGLRRGNKIKNKIKIPKWILKNNDYRRACIRGLFDTDGGLFFHRHSKWKDKRPYLGWCFTSSSLPLLDDFYETMMILGIPVKKVADNRLYMYSIINIVKYLKIVGSNNVKNINKFEYYLNIRESAKKVFDEYDLDLRRGAPNW